MNFLHIMTRVINYEHNVITRLAIVAYHLINSLKGNLRLYLLGRCQEQMMLTCVQCSSDIFDKHFCHFSLHQHPAAAIMNNNNTFAVWDASSVTRYYVDLFFWAVSVIENLSSSIKIAKLGTKVGQLLNKNHTKISQKIVISLPNLVTLDARIWKRNILCHLFLDFFRVFFLSFFLSFSLSLSLSSKWRWSVRQNDEPEGRTFLKLSDSHWQNLIQWQFDRRFTFSFVVNPFSLDPSHALSLFISYTIYLSLFLHLSLSLSLCVCVLFTLYLCIRVHIFHCLNHSLYFTLCPSTSFSLYVWLSLSLFPNLCFSFSFSFCICLSISFFLSLLVWLPLLPSLFFSGTRCHSNCSHSHTTYWFGHSTWSFSYCICLFAGYFLGLKNSLGTGEIWTCNLLIGGKWATTTPLIQSYPVQTLNSLTVKYSFSLSLV